MLLARVGRLRLSISIFFFNKFQVKEKTLCEGGKFYFLVIRFSSPVKRKKKKKKLAIRQTATHLNFSFPLFIKFPYVYF